MSHQLQGLQHWMAGYTQMQALSWWGREPYTQHGGPCSILQLSSSGFIPVTAILRWSVLIPSKLLSLPSSTVSYQRPSTPSLSHSLEYKTWRDTQKLGRKRHHHKLLPWRLLVPFLVCSHWVKVTMLVLGKDMVAVSGVLVHFLCPPLPSYPSLHGLLKYFPSTT